MFWLFFSYFFYKSPLSYKKHKKTGEDIYCLLPLAGLPAVIQMNDVYKAWLSFL